MMNQYTMTQAEYEEAIKALAKRRNFECVLHHIADEYCDESENQGEDYGVEDFGIYLQEVAKDTDFYVKSNGTVLSVPKGTPCSSTESTLVLGAGSTEAHDQTGPDASGATDAEKSTPTKTS